MTPTTKLDQFTIPTAVTDPVEITIQFRDGRRNVLFAANRDSAVQYSLTPENGTTPLSIANLQAKGAYPRKAATGWQALMVAFVASGLGEIVDIK